VDVHYPQTSRTPYVTLSEDHILIFGAYEFGAGIFQPDQTLSSAVRTIHLHCLELRARPWLVR
jgi:hypothetical protein